MKSIFQKVVAQVLKRNHYSVDLEYSGDDGLDTGLSGIYYIIILDIMLPRMDGIGILKELGCRKTELINDGILKYMDIQLNPLALLLRCGHKEIELTFKESQLLELLIKRNSMIISRDYY